MYIVVLAGGTGTRLWPRSRRQSPKQLLDLVDEASMLQRTVSRINPICPSENVFISTGTNYAEMIQAQLPQLPAENVIVELAPRGTAPCIGLSAIYLQRYTDDDVMATLHADAFIQEEKKFRRILQAALEAARQDHLVTIGIQPRYPETGFGYIERGELLTTIDEQPVYRVERFTEKPDPETAQRFVDSGRYYWNSGMFVWKISRILAEIERHQPRLYKKLRQIQDAFGTPDEAETVARIWDEIENQTIDVAIMEQAEDVVVIPADIGWSDVGSWDSLADVMAGSTDDQGNVELGKGHHIGIDTENTLVYSSDRLVATIGLEDMVVVDTGDALLVCPKDQAQRVKELVNRLRDDELDRYL